MTTQTRDQISIGFQPGPIVTLYDLDLTAVGDPTVLHFTYGGQGNSVQPVSFQGVTYTPVELTSQGWARSGSGAFPQPTIRVSNVNSIFSGLVRQYQDLIGAQLTRKRLFASFLDGGGNGGQGTQALFAVDVYNLYQKTTHNKLYVEWKLASAMDQQGQQLPARIVMRDSCGFAYRTFNTTTGAFDYSIADCPYTGAACFDATGASTTTPNDVCGKKTSDCQKRFSGAGYLPFGGFPGAGSGTA
jgi:lambda family phage minor tail protein L